MTLRRTSARDTGTSAWNAARRGRVAPAGRRVARGRAVLVTALVGVLAALGAAPATAVAGAAPQPPGPRAIVDPTSKVISAATWAAYRKAMSDSAVAEPGEVVQNLIVLDHSDSRVQWRTIDGEEYVLVGTLRRNALTDVAPGQSFTLRSDNWVSIPGQLADKCAANNCGRLSPAALDLRLKQLLGLPPDANYSVVNRYWARPADMFRPCTDPRVTSASCPQQVLEGDQTPPVPTTVGMTNLDHFLWVQADYAWRMPNTFDPASAVSCAAAYPEPASCYGFPWTRLGYTYDWTDDKRDVGLTEFVVAKGSTVYLEAVGGQPDFFPRAR